MFNILKLAQKKLSLSILIFMAAGFITGLILKNTAGLKSFILPLTFLMVFPMMVTLPLRQIASGKDMKLQIVAQIINFGIIPFLGFGIGSLFFGDNPEFLLGFLLVSLLPTSGMTISWTGMSKGNMPAAVKMTVLGLILGSVAAPFYIQWLMGAKVSVPLSKIIIQVAVIVVLPLIFGFLTQSLLIRKFGAVKYKEEIKQKFPPFSTLGVLLMVFTAMALKADSIVTNPLSFLSLIVPLLLLYILNLILSTIIGKRFFNREDALSLVYGTVLRNLSIALAIAMTSFGKEGSGMALVIALGYIIQIQLSALYVKFSDRIFGSPSASIYR